ncbi:MAG: response regulator transcription factor [Lachnospiraceae bacterium]|nr:response regulator transcription factor [Lachnospiraceae bacterium]
MIIESANLGEVTDMASSLDELVDIVRINPEFDLLIIDSSLVTDPTSDADSIFDRENIKAPTLFILDTSNLEILLKKRYFSTKGIISRNASLEQFTEALGKLIEHKDYYQPELIPGINSLLLKNKEDDKKLASLTKRELEVLKGAASGLLNKEIGTSLNISERTVKNHLASIFKKIEVKDRTQAAVFAIKNNLIKIG